jgi:ABC-type sugar transport system permease subunit
MKNYNQMKITEAFLSYLFIAPAFLLVVGLLLIPMTQNVYLSFFDWNGITKETWAGFGNFTKFFSDEVFIQSMINTVLWVLFEVVWSVSLGLLIAVFVKGMIGENFFKSVFFLPLAISFVSTGAIWMYMLSKDYGVVNEILGFFGVQQKVAWLFLTPLNTLSMMFALSWQQLGGHMVLFLMGLTSIPKDVIEASQIDGCTKWQTFVHVTFPMLKPITTVVVGMAIVNSFKTFDIIYLMTRGGPIRSSETLAVTMFIEAFQRSNLGYGAAISVFLSLIILPISAVYIRSMSRTHTIDVK